MVTATDPSTAASLPPVCLEKRRWLSQVAHQSATRRVVLPQVVLHQVAIPQVAIRPVALRPVAFRRGALRRTGGQPLPAEPRREAGMCPARRRAARLRPGTLQRWPSRRLDAQHLRGQKI
jgi:hypothetical protein